MATPTEEPGNSDLRLLLIEDSPLDVELAVRRLRAAGYLCRYRCVVNESEMRSELAGELPRLLLSDFTFHAFDCISPLAIALPETPDVPVIFLSGTIGE